MVGRDSIYSLEFTTIEAYVFWHYNLQHIKHTTLHCLFVAAVGFNHWLGTAAITCTLNMVWYGVTTQIDEHGCSVQFKKQLNE